MRHGQRGPAPEPPEAGLRVARVAQVQVERRDAQGGAQAASHGLGVGLLFPQGDLFQTQLLYQRDKDIKLGIYYLLRRFHEHPRQIRGH